MLLPRFQESDGSASVAALSPCKKLPEEQMAQIGRKEVPTAIPQALGTGVPINEIQLTCMPGCVPSKQERRPSIGSEKGHRI